MGGMTGQPLSCAEGGKEKNLLEKQKEAGYNTAVFGLFDQSEKKGKSRVPIAPKKPRLQNSNRPQRGKKGGRAFLPLIEKGKERGSPAGQEGSRSSPVGAVQERREETPSGVGKNGTYPSLLCWEGGREGSTSKRPWYFHLPGGGKKKKKKKDVPLCPAPQEGKLARTGR